METLQVFIKTEEVVGQEEKEFLPVEKSCIEPIRSER